jgi:hypothetical protein
MESSEEEDYVVETPSYDTADGGEVHSPGPGTSSSTTPSSSVATNQVNAKGKLKWKLSRRGHS